MKFASIRRVGVPLMAACLTLLYAGPSRAATLTVNSTIDAPDANPGNGICDDGAAHCTLRAALQEVDSNSAGSTNTINIPAGMYVTTTTLLLNRLDPLVNLTINGIGAAGTVIVDASGGISHRVFNISSGGTVNISNLTIQNGADIAGAGILATIGTVNISQSLIANNNASGSGGGMYLNNGVTLNLDRSTVSNNSSSGDAGGINVNGGTANITDSAIINNHASAVSGSGGGIRSLATLSVSNSTISGNTANNGGAITAIGNLTSTLLSNVTVTGNTATQQLEGAAGAVIGVFSSAIANPLGGTANCAGSMSSIDYNLDSTATCNFVNVHDISNTDPMLGPLANNGGPTLTHALLAGSPAIDKGSNMNSLSTDQRGIGFPRVSGAAADIGAFETTSAAPLVNGLCGSDNGTIVTSSPVNLCAAGSASIPAYNNSSFDWTCAGSGGGTTAICSATINYLVTTSVTGGNGTISANQTVAYLATPSFTLTPAPGFVAGPVTGSCGGTLVANVFTITPVVDVCTVVASFTAGVGGTAPTFTSGQPPSGALGAPYSFTFTAIGSNPIVFSLAPGTILPPGLSLSPSGVLGGTPTSSSIGPWTGTVIASNGTLPDASFFFSFMIPNPVVTPASVTPIPTLSEWALIMMMGLMACVGLGALRRHSEK